MLYIEEPVVDMRESPREGSKVVSQALFSEHIVLQEKRGEWALIRTPDSYSGWVQSASLIKREKPYQPSLQVIRLAAHIYGIDDIEYGPLKTVPYGSRLELVDGKDPRWMTVVLLDGTIGYIQKGDVAPFPRLKGSEDLVSLSKQFLGLPYTWGGRSSFGYDCSGFVQMLYQQIGLSLPRDTKDQIREQRARLIPIDDIKPCNLIFFGKSEQDIRHVAMYLGDGSLIHASAREGKPWLRISHLSDPEWSGEKHAYYPYRTACCWPSLPK